MGGPVPKEREIPKDIYQATIRLYGQLDLDAIIKFQNRVEQLLRNATPNERKSFLRQLDRASAIVDEMAEGIGKMAANWLGTSVIGSANTISWKTRCIEMFASSCEEIRGNLGDNANFFFDRILQEGSLVIGQLGALNIAVAKNPDFRTNIQRITSPSNWERATTVATRLFGKENGEKTQVIAGVAYALIVLGSEESIERMYKTCGLMHFYRYSKTILLDSLQNLDTSPSDPRPVLIRFSAYYDNNGAQAIMEPNISSLNRFYRVILVESDSDKKTIEMLKGIRNRNGRFAAAVLKGHSDSKGMRLGYNKKPESILDSSDSSKDGFFAKLESMFIPGYAPLIITMGCNSGTGPAPFSKSISERISSARVWAIAELYFSGHSKGYNLSQAGEIISYDFRGEKGRKGKIRIFVNGRELDLSVAPKKLALGKTAGTKG